MSHQVKRWVKRWHIKSFFKKSDSILAQKWQLMLFIYLIHKTTPSPRDMRPMKQTQRKLAIGLRPVRYYKGNPPPLAVRCAQYASASPPYKEDIRKNKQRNNKLPLAPGCRSFHRLPCHPFIYSRDMSTVLVYPIGHHPSYPPIALGT
jgi:hypothetical protein